MKIIENVKEKNRYGDEREAGMQGLGLFFHIKNRTDKNFQEILVL